MEVGERGVPLPTTGQPALPRGFAAVFDCRQRAGCVSTLLVSCRVSNGRDHFYSNANGVIQ